MKEHLKSTDNREMRRLNYEISIAQHLTYTRKGSFHPASLKDVLCWIGNQKNWILHYGNLHATLGEVTDYIRVQHDPSVQNQLKKDWMPVVMFNGVFKSASLQGYELESYSSVTALDFDNIESQEQSDAVMRDLQGRPYVVAVFHTFKPFRLKAVVAHDNTDPLRHSEMYEALASEFDESLLDKKCKNLTRRNYLVYDPNIMVRSDFNSFKPYHFEPNQQAQRGFADAALNSGVGNIAERSYSGKQASPYSIVNILMKSWKREHPEYWQEGNRAMSIFKCAVQLCRYGVKQNITEDKLLRSWIPCGMSGDEIRRQIDGAYKHEQNNYGKYSFYVS